LLQMGILLGIAAFAETAGATPVAFRVEGFVETIGGDGLVPADGVPVAVCPCFQFPGCLATCRDHFSISTSTASGRFSTVAGFSSPELVVAAARIGDVVLRGLAFTMNHSAFVVIDPISEAASRLIENGDYSSRQGEQILILVRSANFTTDLAGLSLNDAVELAQTVALGDPAVMEALTAWTPTATPTATNTSTQTPTRTLHATGTPRICMGDCNRDGRVQVDEVITGVSLVLGLLPDDVCMTGYRSQVDVADLLTVVGNALDRCGSLDPLPDLSPFGLQFIDPALTCSDPYQSPVLCLSVCVANVGDLGAPPFDVEIDGGSRLASWRVDGLIAGDGACHLACGTGYDGFVRVDVKDEVSESRQDNNVLSFRAATPTPPPTCPSPTPT
jgi:hypothetical protein